MSHDFPKGLILTPVSEGKQKNVAGNQMFASEVALPAHMINSRPTIRVGVKEAIYIQTWDTYFCQQFLTQVLVTDLAVKRPRDNIIVSVFDSLK